MAMQLKERANLNGQGDASGLDLGPAPGAKGRRIPEIAGGLLFVVVCSLGAMWWHASSTDTQPVLAMRNPVEAGHVVTIEDLQVVGIGTDAAVAVLADTESSLVVGRVARSDLPAGALVVESQFADGSLVASGDGVVGLSLEPGEFPLLSLAVGDIVGVVLTPATGDPRSFGEGVEAVVLVPEAVVVEVAPLGVQDHRFVSIQVDEANAARVAAAAAANRVRLIQVSGDGA